MSQDAAASVSYFSSDSPSTIFHNSSSRLIMFWHEFTIDTHMTVEDDGPYESENDGGPSIYDIWDVYIHHFDLHQPTTTTVNKNTLQIQMPCFFLWKLTDFLLRKFSAVSMLALCWKTPRPLCLFCGDKSQHQIYCNNNVHFSTFLCCFFFFCTSPILVN